MKIDTSKYRVDRDAKVDLAEWATDVAHLYASDAEYETELHERVDRLAKLQEQFYATDRKALLVVLQGMDTSGKDGLIRHIFSGLNPQGCEVHNFKQPTSEELHHDFLWRGWVRLPGRGHIGVFNRSYYEELLVVRVHPEYLEPEGYSRDIAADKDFWKDRYRAITEMERHLDRSHTQIVKILLHISKEEQRKRLITRIDEVDKNWKVNPGDLTERGHWADYMDAYGRLISETSTNYAPWFIVPGDDKQNARLIVAEIILGVFAGLDLRPPDVSKERRTSLLEMKRALEAEAPKPAPAPAETKSKTS